MRKIIYLALGAFLLLSCEKENSDLIENNIKGKISSIILNEYRVTDSFFDVGQAKFYSRTETYYNETGNKTEEKFFNNNYKLTKTIEYSYDASQKLIKTKTTEISPWETNVREYEYEYNNKGILITMVYKLKNVFHYKTAYFYDGKGLLIEEKVFRDMEMTMLNGYTKYTYDSKGNMIEYSNHTGSGRLENRHEHSYYNNKKVKEIIGYSAHDKFVYKRVFSYDGKGNTTEIVIYNDKGQKAQQINYEYEYDSRNWVKMTTRNNLIAVALVEREIEYRK